MGRNHFYDLFNYASLKQDPTYEAWHFTSLDNPKLDPSEIEIAKKSMSSYAFRQEFLASFEAMGSEIFKEDWVNFDEEPDIGDYYIAVDLAGFENVGAISQGKSNRLDSTAIAVVKVNEQGWYIADIIHGRWDLNTTANKIFQAVDKYDPVAVGIERGIAKQAVMSPLMDLQKRRQKFFRVEELTHGNKKKTDRIVWALQGRFENGYVSLAKGEWNNTFLDQLFQFPNPLVHDDLIDALAYIDQLAKVPYHYEDFEFDDFEMLDPMAGY
jgi:predicted phage terminase large subunit-like protein